MPEQVRAAAAGVLGHQMAAGLEQTAALDRKQRGAADRQLPRVQERCHPSQSHTRGLDGADQCVVTARLSRLM